MKLSKKALDELLVILKKDTGIDYSEEDAQEVGGILLRLMRIAIRHDPVKYSSNDQPAYPLNKMPK